MLNYLPIHTDRLVLRAISQEYIPHIFREFTAEIARFMHPQPADDISETEDFVNQSMAENQAGSNLQLVILDKNNEFLGLVGLHKIDCKTPEFGIWLKKSAHNKGYGKEAIQALKKFADQYLDYHHILYPVDRSNIPSRKIPESLGGIVSGEYIEKNPSGTTLDLVEYHIFP